jgi:hypothetical protein
MPRPFTGCAVKNNFASFVTQGHRKKKCLFSMPSGFEPVQIPIPFPWQKLFFLGVAGFAAGHQIEFFRPPPPGQRNDVIHGQFRRSNGSTAIMTDTGGPFAFPPLGVPQFSGFGPLFFYNRFILKQIRYHDILTRKTRNPIAHPQLLVF